MGNVDGTDILISPRGVSSLLRAGVESAATAETDVSTEDFPPEDLARMRAGLERALVIIDDELVKGRGSALFAADHMPTSLLQSFLAEKAAERGADLTAQEKLIPLAGGGFEAKFDDDDLKGWAKSFFTWWGRLFNKHPFLTPPVAPDKRLANHSRIAVVGDWGTGRYGAPVCAASIQKANPAFDVLLHLGDVYYSGTPEEIKNRFMAHWPKVPGALNRAINSNHEMYSGGKGFFEITLKQFEQPASCFALENDHFLLVGLDTGYDEHDLTEAQVPWVLGLANRAKVNGQKIILFSHHQPFSMMERGGQKLQTKLGPLLEAKQVVAWYWGHEHRAVIYEKHAGWQMYGRLVGHGGYPYFRDKVTDISLIKPRNADGSSWHRLKKPGVPDAMVLDGKNIYLPGEEDQYGPHGYLTLELDGPKIHEEMCAADGTVLWKHDIP